MRAKIARWFLNRANSRINKDESLKFRIVLSDSRMYLDVVDETDPETPYPVSEGYFDNAALFYKGFVNEIGIQPDGVVRADGGTADPDETDDVDVNHVEIPVDGDAVEQVEQTEGVELVTTEAYKKHMTNHVFEQALTPVDPESLGGMAFNKYYIWVALLLLGIIAFGVAAGGLGGGGAAALLPLVPKVMDR